MVKAMWEARFNAWKVARYNCMKNCAVRVNIGLAALVPVVDQLQLLLPSLQPHLPANVYSIGFVIMAIMNTILHIRKPPHTNDEPG